MVSGLSTIILDLNSNNIKVDFIIFGMGNILQA